MITVLLLIAVIQVSETNYIPRIFDKTTAAMVVVPDQNFTVKTFVKGDDVYIECYMRDYRFTESNQKELASIAVSIDGRNHSERKTAAFIVKDLTNGKHTIKLELINDSGKKLGLTKEFEVHIQSAI